MFYNTKIRSLFVMIYVLQHIFNRYLNFIDLGQKKQAFLIAFQMCIRDSGYHLHRVVYLSIWRLLLDLSILLQMCIRDSNYYIRSKKELNMWQEVIESSLLKQSLVLYMFKDVYKRQGIRFKNFQCILVGRIIYQGFFGKAAYCFPPFITI